MLEVRSFARRDRDGLVSLVNRHVAAVLPGGAVPVSLLLSQMERDSAEAIIDPWVIDRHSLVVIERDRVVAAAHLKRYAADERVNDSYKNAADIDWIVCEPATLSAGAALLEGAKDVLRSWNATRWHVDGSLPCLGVYGIPDNWPHIQALLEQAGFSDAAGQVEVVFAGDLADVDPAGVPPMASLRVRRVVGPLGTSFEAELDGNRVGVFEVEDSYGAANAQLARWADESNHWVLPEHRGNGVGTWLFRHGCEWLRLGGKTRLLTYAIERRAEGLSPMEADVAKCEAYYARHGLRRIARTRRGWTCEPD